MVSIKIKNHNIHWNIFPFSQNTLQQKSEKIDQIISQISSKDIPNKKLPKKSAKIRLMPYLTILSQVCSSKIYIGSQKVVAIWQHLIVNRQRLTHVLTMVDHNIFLNYSTCNNTKFLCHVVFWSLLSMD